MPRMVHRRGWIWLATATIAMAYLACAQESLHSARSYAHPVLQFLAGHTSDPASTVTSTTQRPFSVLPARVQRDSQHSGFWLAMLPVFFVGLVTPLGLLPARSRFSLGRAPSASAYFSLFQRPPPFVRS